jgi:hypothetical protein
MMRTPLKHLLALATSESGVSLRLTLPPMPVGDVPLFTAANVEVQG